MNSFSFAKYKAGISFFLIIIFSVANFLWKSNVIVKTFNKTTSLFDHFVYSLDKMGSSVLSVFEIYIVHKNYQEQINVLEQRLFDYERLYVEYHHLLEENGELRNLLDFPEIEGYEILKSKVISFNSKSWSQQILVNKGSINGVAPFMPVVSLEYYEELVGDTLKKNPKYIVVGKTMYVSENFTRILPITSSFFKTGVRIKSKGYWSMFSGFDEELNGPVLEFLNLDSTVLFGEQVVTSGGEGIYPPNLFMGIIGDKSTRFQGFQKVNVDLVVKLDELDYVIILKKKKQLIDFKKEVGILNNKKEVLFYKKYLEK